MGKKGLTLVLIGVGALLLFGQQAITSIVDKFTFGKPKIKFGAFKLLPPSVKIEVTMPVTNGNAVTLPLNGFDLRLLYGKQELGPVQSAGLTDLPANTTTNVNFSVTVGLLGAAQGVIDVIQNKNYTQPFYLKGTVNIRGKNYPYYQTVSLI